MKPRHDGDRVHRRKSLLVKLLSIVILTTAIGWVLLIYKVIQSENRNLFEEQVKASRDMAQPILHSLYKDMLDERADMARYLVLGVQTIEGVKRVKVIRENGREEAFQDLKTVKEVEKVHGELRPEWSLDHPDKPVNVAEGVHDPRFQEALKLFKGGREEAVYYVEEAGGERMMTYLLPIVKKTKCDACHDRDESIRGVLMVSTSLETMYAALAAGRRNWISLGFLTLVGTCLALGFMVRSVIARPILQTTDVLREIADGKGDLRKRLVVTSADEVGVMRGTLNKFIEGLQGMIRDILRSSDEVALLSSGISKASEGFHKTVKSQTTAVEETYASIIEMDKSSGHVRSNAENLLTSVQGAFDSSRKMSVAVTEIARDTEALDAAVGRTSDATHQIVSFQRKIASHIGALYAEIEQVVSVASIINEAIKEVEDLSKGQASLAEKVVQVVATHMDAVNRSTGNIDRMIEDVTKTSAMMNELGERSKTISGIIDVIGEIADTSRLLSVNAAILAAQAGDQGKGFEIVANEIKVLSEQTASSTKEITKLIEQVQKDIASSSASVEHSISTVVEEMVRLSKDTGEAVGNIENGSAAALAMARKVEKASQAQNQAVGQVADAINKINGMVAEIKLGIESQYGASDDILRAADHMQETTLSVKRSILEQSVQGQQINAAIKDVAEKMQAIIRSIREHKDISERAVEAIDVIRTNSSENASRAGDLDQLVEYLSEQAALLKSNGERFRV